MPLKTASRGRLSETWYRRAGVGVKSGPGSLESMYRAMRDLKWLTAYLAQGEDAWLSRPRWYGALRCPEGLVKGVAHEAVERREVPVGRGGVAGLCALASEIAGGKPTRNLVVSA